MQDYFIRASSLKEHIEKRVSLLKTKAFYTNHQISREEIINRLSELQYVVWEFGIEIGPDCSFDIPDWLKE